MVQSRREVSSTSSPWRVWGVALFQEKKRKKEKRKKKKKELGI